MRHKRGVDRSQSALLPPSVEDFVGPAHLVRVIDAFVARQDMVGLGFDKSRPAATGRPPYAPDDLLRLYIYGYWQRIRSSRALERECQRNLEVMYLVRQLAFDHKTIANFRKDNAAAIEAVCAQFVQFVRGAGVLEGSEAVVAIDGSKFKASAAQGSVVDEASAAARRQRLSERIGQYLEQMDALDAREQVASEASAEQLQAALLRLLEQDHALAQAQTVIAEQAQAQAQAQAPTEPEAADAHTPESHTPEPRAPEAIPVKPQVGLTDVDAVNLRHGQVGYNVQAAVEAHSKLIVAHEVTRQANDHRALAPTAQAAQAALPGQRLTVVADTGYMNGEQAQRCEQSGITPVVPMQRVAHNSAQADLYPKSAFVYEAASDTYRCPAGALLERYRRSRTEQVDHYRTAACGSCGHKGQCTASAQRTIARSWFAAAAQRADERARSDPSWMRLRACTVEHRFGLLKALMPGGFLVRGLQKVRGEMALAVLTVNLRRVMNMWGAEKLMQMLSAPVPARA